MIEGRSGKREGTGLERKRRYLVDPASSHMLVLKIKPCMPEYRWTKNRDCGWLIKSVRISLVKRGMRRITLLIVELIQEKDIGWCGVYCTGPIAFISSVFVVVCDAGSLKATGTDGWHLGMRTTCDLTARHP